MTVIQIDASFSPAYLPLLIPEDGADHEPDSNMSEHEDDHSDHNYNGTEYENNSLKQDKDVPLDSVSGLAADTTDILFHARENSSKGAAESKQFHHKKEESEEERSITHEEEEESEEEGGL